MGWYILRMIRILKNIFVLLQGHSLGGSLATLLMLMYVRRGVLPPVAIAPVYTFGAPAILCESCVCGTSTCGLDGREQPCQCSPDHGAYISS